MKPKNAGFSIIEIMVAISVGGIMTAVAVQSFNDIYEAYRLRAATYQVFVALQSARAEAVKKNNNYRFSVVNQTTYQLHDDTNSNGVIDAGETVTQKNMALEVKGTQLFYWATPFSFTPVGTTTGGWDWDNWVAITNDQWEWRWIEISRTGRVKIY